MRPLRPGIALPRWLPLLWLGCAGSPAAPPRPEAAPCALSTPPQVLERSATELHQLWQLPEEPALYGGRLPRDPALADYTRAVRARIDPDPRALLQRQHDLFVASRNPQLLPEAQNAAPILAGRLGRIAPINCLEALLWSAHAAGRALISQPSEFGAFLLRRPTGAGAELRIYFSSMERSGGRINRQISERVDADVQAGWRLQAHLHSHPFLFDRVVGDRSWTTADTKDDIAGALAPSATDVQYYHHLMEDLGLQGAWITNGFHTIHLDAAEIQRLRGRR